MYGRTFLFMTSAENTLQEWRRCCPKCSTEILYSSYYGFLKAKNKNRVCKKCAYELISNKLSGRVVSQITKEKISASRTGISAWNKGIPMSDESKIKLSNSLKGREVWSKGKQFSKEYVKKLQDSHMGQISPMKGKKHTDETRYKIRMAILNDIKSKGISHRSNPIACKFIDNLNKERGWNLQHAGNGGEVQIYGYLLDGYDKDNKIVFEYDEPQHHRKKKKENDIKRQNDIFKYFQNIGEVISFWRYDERYDNLYEVKML